MGGPGEKLFDVAAKVFEGREDPETGLRVLRVLPRDPRDKPGEDRKPWRTIYHQNSCFLNGGRRVLLRRAARGGGRSLLDLATGEAAPFVSEDYYPIEVSDASGFALLVKSTKEGAAVVFWDVDAGKELSAFVKPDWTLWSGKITADGRRAIIGHFRGKYYDEHCSSVFHVLDVDGGSKKILEADGYFCNHIMPCPTDPEIFSYNRWPSPQRRTEVVIRIRDIDGTFEEPLPQIEGTVRPGTIWGGQRDHYLWSPDGRRIVSYFSRKGIEDQDKDHFEFGWWVSAMDWRTGEDFAVKYPVERWGCNFGISPDSRYIVSAGGRGFQRLYLIDIENLRDGWNEHMLCSYPHSIEDGKNQGPFHMPFVLPDQSGIIFSAGFGGPEDGAFMVEWPGELATSRAPE